MNIKGKLHEVGAIQQVTDTFKKRDLIIEIAENPTYPEYVKFELMQDKTSLADGLKVGDEIDLDFNLKGRPYTDKTGKTAYFNSLVIWKINITQQTTIAETVKSPGEEDDLPF